MKSACMKKGLIALVAMLAVCGQSQAQPAAANDATIDRASGSRYPTKPVRVIISTSPSGGTDYAARMFGQKLSEMWGQSVVLDNRPGATGMIGLDVVAHANPDGYTLLVMNVGHLITAALAMFLRPCPQANEFLSPVWRKSVCRDWPRLNTAICERMLRRRMKT